MSVLRFLYSNGINRRRKSALLSFIDIPMIEARGSFFIALTGSFYCLKNALI